MTSSRFGAPVALAVALALCPIVPSGAAVAAAAAADPDSAGAVAPPPPAAKRARLSAPT